MNNDSPRLRLGIVGVLSLSLFAALFARLWYLQVMASPEYQAAAVANQRRVIIEEAPRGRILDRNGVVIVDNRTSIVVTVDRVVFGELDKDARKSQLVRLSGELTMYGVPTTVEQLGDRLVDVRFSPYTPVPVAEDVPEELEVFLREHKDVFPGVRVEVRSVRSYPLGRLASHILGYVGPITGDELEVRANSPKTYEQTDDIGKSGVEKIYEDDLRGIPGRRILEVDAFGNPVRELPGYTAPIPGDDVYLTIDVRLQALAERALYEELLAARARPPETGPRHAAPAGSVVVLDPNNGQVIAMASYPDYDPAQFVNGISTAEFAVLQDPSQHGPLNNRAIQGEYAPGSTFKLVTATAGLRSGLIAPQDTVLDQGEYLLPQCNGDTCIFRNAQGISHGRVNVTQALTVSSDVFFYNLGARFFFGSNEYGYAIQDTARDLGFEAQTGVPLPAEHGGFVPDPNTFVERFGEGTRFLAGNNVNTAIGQGEMLVTPLQLANAYATFANGGTLYSPNIALRVVEAGTAGPTETVVRPINTRALRQVALPPEVRLPILEGLVGVTSLPGGTARPVFQGFPNWTIAGKTGTAEVNNKADTSLFAAFGPAEAPQYTVVAVLEESGFGSEAAAPLVRRLLEALSDQTLLPQLLGNNTFLFPVLPEDIDPGSAPD